ncbi:MAG TPA: Gfo/Idh/MocA family oxidoreductase [Chthoniobacteraceae bacterium]|nr:Gfo/Idh/MocA family oxidoreductase [Chthoniobacteraceae bacterium]
MSLHPFTPLNLCIAGIGGFARHHHAEAFELEQQGEIRLLATCDPRHARLGEVAQSFAFARRGVAVLAGFEEMLARFAPPAHLVSIATPIHCHAAMHAAVASRNIGCYLEKPPTLDPGELEAMIAVEAGHDFQTEVSFNYLAEPWRRELKQRLLDGEWGELLGLSLYGAWSRDAAYYRRSPWAGKLSLHGRLVLDSCFGNAVSHNVHNLLFFAGREGVLSWARPREVRCELYRAYAIEGADTVFSEMITEEGLPLRVALSHACEPGRDLLEIIRCERAEIRIRPYESVEILHRGGQREIRETDSAARLFRDQFVRYLAYLRGEEERPLTTLADCRPLVTWNALNHLAARAIHPIPAAACTVDADGSMRITGIEESLRAFLRTGAFPSGQGVGWSRRGDAALAGEVSGLRECILEMAEREKNAV